MIRGLPPNNFMTTTGSILANNFMTTRWSTREQFHDDKHFSKQSLARNLIYIVIFNHLSEISNVALLMCRL